MPEENGKRNHNDGSSLRPPAQAQQPIWNQLSVLKDNNFMDYCRLTKIVFLVFAVWTARLTWELFRNKHAQIQSVVNPDVSDAFSETNYQRLVQFGQVYTDYEHFEIRTTLRVVDLNQINSQQVQKQIRKEFEGMLLKHGVTEGTVTVKDLGFDVFEILMLVSEEKQLKEIVGVVSSDELKNSVISNLVGSMSGVVLASEYRMDPAIVERVQAIVGGLPMGYQFFMGSTNKLMQELANSFQRSQKYLMDGIRITEALKEDQVYYTKQANNLQTKLNELEKQLEKTEKALESSEAEFSQKSRVYLQDQKVLEQKVQELLKQIMDYEGINTDLRREYQVLDHEQKRLQEEIVGVQEQLGYVKDSEVRAKNHAMSLQQEYSMLVDAKKGAESDLSNFESAVSEVYAALGSVVDIELVRPEVVKAITPRVLALNAQIKEMEDVISERSSRMKEILLELDSVDLIKKEYNDTISTYTSQIEVLESKLSQSEQKILDLENQLQQQSLIISQRTKEREEIEKQIFIKSEEVRRVTMEIEELQSTCANYANILKLVRGFALEITNEYNDMVHQVEDQPPISYTTTTSKKVVSTSTQQQEEVQQS